jgi:hypothetical protein
MIVPSWARGPRGGEQIVLAHQPQHPPPRGGAGPAVAQPRPHLAVALAVERAGRQHRPDRFQQVGIRHRPGRPRSPRGGRARRLAMTVDSRAGDAPGAADPREPVRLAAGRRGRPAHRLGLLRAKGRPVSRAAIFSSSSSCRSSISPSRAFSRSLASVSPSAGRVASAARLARGQEGVTPGGQRRRCHPERARDRLQVLAAQQPQHGLPLARPGHPPAPARSDRTRIRRRCRHGPPPLRTRSAYEVSRSTVGRGT